VWKAPDIEGLVDFLVKDKGFKSVSPLSLSLARTEMVCSEDRVRKSADKLKMRLNSKAQGRLDGFFSVLPKDPNATPKKRKVRPSPPSHSVLY
jgi:flap endonuclease-1